MNDITQALSNLEAWLETMRVPGGYGGPVVHWWQNCLAYTGPGCDWRYEGIIAGYVTLWQRTGNSAWLDKARCAGDDLLGAQLPGGNFRASAFELNPYPGGTPHEAAADVGLLLLSRALRAAGSQNWNRYAETAERNLRSFYIGRLWDNDAQLFVDNWSLPSFVPNKACTIVEALILLSELQGSNELIECYALPTLRQVVSMQRRDNGLLKGAFAQAQIRNRVVEKYFPYYVARCIPALVQTYRLTREQQWLDAAMAARDFILLVTEESGLLPQVVYLKGMNRWPQWLAPLGDCLRAVKMLDEYMPVADVSRTEAALLAAQVPSGGFATARGFDSQVSARQEPRTDFRDLVCVSGWNDKVFRFLAGRAHLEADLPLPNLAPFRTKCTVKKQPASWEEDYRGIRLRIGSQTAYSWEKGQLWASKLAPVVMWK